MTRRVRILAHCPDPTDGTAWYRCVSPFGRLQESRDDIELSVTKTEITHSDISRHDVLFLQRPCTPWAVNAARVAKSYGLSVWLDYDDPYHDVPPNNPRFMLYQSPEVQQSLREVCAAADLVSVSTLRLREDFVKFNPRCCVLSNGLDETITLPPRDPNMLPIRRVLWRGGDSHNEDLLQFSDAIAAAANSDAPYHVWSFWGLTPHWLMPRLPYGSAQIVGWVQFQDYFRHLPTVSPSIVIVPLANTHFNQCKSNIALLESALVGAVPLVPRWQEWHAPGAAYYTDEKTFEQQLTLLMKAPLSELRSRAAETLKWARKEQGVDVVNILRSKLLDLLLIEKTPKWRLAPTTPKGVGMEAAEEGRPSLPPAKPFDPEVTAS